MNTEFLNPPKSVGLKHYLNLSISIGLKSLQSDSNRLEFQSVRQAISTGKESYLIIPYTKTPRQHITRYGNDTT